MEKSVTLNTIHTLIAILKITHLKMLVFLTILICNKNLKMTNHVPLLLLGWIVFEVKEKNHKVSSWQCRQQNTLCEGKVTSLKKMFTL